MRQALARYCLTTNSAETAGHLRWPLPAVPRKRAKARTRRTSDGWQYALEQLRARP